MPGSLLTQAQTSETRDSRQPYTASTMLRLSAAPAQAVEVCDSSEVIEPAMLALSEASLMGRDQAPCSFERMAAASPVVLRTSYS